VSRAGDKMEQCGTLLNDFGLENVNENLGQTP